MYCPPSLFTLNIQLLSGVCFVLNCKSVLKCRLHIKRGRLQSIDVAVFSAGAALGPLLAGLISPTGWNNVFYMLISADVLACLVRNTTSSFHLNHSLIALNAYPEDDLG